MLHIYFGDMPSAIYNTEMYFRNTYEDSWMLDDFSKKVIKKIDGSEVVDAEAITAWFIVCESYCRWRRVMCEQIKSKLHSLKLCSLFMIMIGLLYTPNALFRGF